MLSHHRDHTYNICRFMTGRCCLSKRFLLFVFFSQKTQFSPYHTKRNVVLVCMILLIRIIRNFKCYFVFSTKVAV